MPPKMTNVSNIYSQLRSANQTSLFTAITDQTSLVTATTDQTFTLTASPNWRCRHRWADRGQSSGWRRRSTCLWKSHPGWRTICTTNGWHSGWTSCLLSSTPPGLRPRVPGTCPGNRAAGTTTTSTAATTTNTTTTTRLSTPWPKPSPLRAASTSLSFRRLLFW